MRHRHSFWSRYSSLALATCLAVVPSLRAQTAGVPQRDDEPIRYDRDIRPILADRCFRCHGPDVDQRKADLRLDDAAAATSARDGRPAIAPGDPDGSELWHRITTADPAEQMPPRRSGKPQLSPEEQQRMRRWIESGAHYEPHWSFTALVPPPVPPPVDDSSCRNEVDRFLRAAQQRRGVAPRPEADRATLARRVFLTLTGLPPTLSELDAFLADHRSDAYERLVDRLLHEEPYRSRHAEHLATPWLDQARYADTCGIHMDAGRQIWPWRDWVLRALRDDMPFDRFVVEQLAGDLLPDATQDQKVASGFHRNHVTTDEGGAIDEEYKVEYAVDRTATTGSVFLGLTLGCARCHDHKYDPITQEDFYRVYAFFNANEEPGLYSQVPDPNRALEPFLAVPSADQERELTAAREHLAAAEAALAQDDPTEQQARTAFEADLRASTGVQWVVATLTGAASTGSATLRLLDDGSVLASGANPATDQHRFTLRTDAAELRLLCLEALPDPSLPTGRVGRAPNGNAVLSAVLVEAVSVLDPTQRHAVPLVWAWADVEQRNGEFRIVNALQDSDGRGWAVGAHLAEPAPRTALFLAGAPFGFAGGTELHVTLKYDSVYAQHVLGRVRLSVGKIADEALARLPEALSDCYLLGPVGGASDDLYEQDFGPETAATLDPAMRHGNAKWRLLEDFAEGRVHTGLPKGRNATYVGIRVFAPTARTRQLELGSDDGFRLFLAGRLQAERRVDRAVAANQDQASVALPPGESALLLKIVNTGGDGGFCMQRKPAADELDADLVALLLPEAAQTPALRDRAARAWRLRFSAGYAQREAAVATATRTVAELEAKLPRTMVMRERMQPSPTFVLRRGEYDKPDRNRPVERGLPAVLGELPTDAPRNRLGLAQWLVSTQNPLLQRVVVNRLWEFVFGTGIVTTTEDFGMQGDFPSHPELLDWLACEFRHRGFSQRQMLRLLVTSAAFRQQATPDAAIRERDPDNRWLCWFPRRRLGAEALRDQALYLSGLLVERLGGPSVKPYQPDGLWQEVAMVQSNTRSYQQGSGDDLWRRSLYTYWKRACPPPTLLLLDAPTREFCTIRRTTTNTPQQALALWNDPQFVEAARCLGERALRSGGDDLIRCAWLHRCCTGHTPSAEATTLMLDTLRRFRGRFAADEPAAAALLAVGAKPRDAALPTTEVAAFALLASALLNLDATLCID